MAPSSIAAIANTDACFGQLSSASMSQKEKPFLYTNLREAQAKGNFSGTIRFISRLDESIRKGNYRRSDLLDFKDRLSTTQQMVSPVHRFSMGSARNFEREYQSIMDRHPIDKQAVINFVSRALEGQQTSFIKDQKEVQAMEFGEVAINQVLNFRGKKAQLKNRISMMTTPVTQNQWLELMGSNPSHFSEGPNSQTITLNNDSVVLQPNNPVENISWWSALVFANRLSEKYGLTPVYDLSQVKFQKGTTAENGTLVAISGILNINAPKEDYLKAEGFRLPAEIEQVYFQEKLWNEVSKNLLAQGMKVNDSWKQDDLALEDALLDRAWLESNSGRMTQPVAQLKPLTLGGTKYFDLAGNVSEMAWDAKFSNLLGEINPVDSDPFGSHIVSGGSVEVSENALGSGHVADIRNRTIGFRLVRTLR